MPSSPIRLGVRALLLAGLAALLLHCGSSDQRGYDVDLIVVPETAANAQNPLPDIQVPVQLSPTRPSYILTNVATVGWYAQLRREGQLRAAGADPGFDMIMDLDSFTADGPVSFAVRVYSQTGFVSGRDVGYIPVSPERCSFTLAPGAAAGEEYAEHLNSCLSDWIVENGVPQQFNMEVSSSLVSGTDYLFAGNWTMKSDAACDSGVEGDEFTDISEGGEIFSALDCSGLMLRGEGITDTEVTVGGGADVWDACGNYISSADIVPQPAAPGTYRIMDAADDFGGGFVSDVIIDFEDGVDVFMEGLFGAADGQCAMGGIPAPDATGRAVFDWTVCGDAPRRGSIKMAIQGNCPAR
jgi:hypothetical protein